MCVVCGVTQAPVCAATGPCAGVFSQALTIGLVAGSIALGTSRLWLHSVTAKVAPFLNTKITMRHEKK